MGAGNLIDQSRPFCASNIDRAFFTSACVEESLARIDYLVQNQAGSGLLTGPDGVGKTELLKYYLRQGAAPPGTQLIDLLQAGTRSVLWELAAGFQLGPRRDDCEFTLWNLFAEHLRGRGLAGMPTVILFDHFDRADESCHWLVERIARQGSGMNPQLTVISAIRQARATAAAAQFAGDLRIELSGVSLEECACYIGHKITASGGPTFGFDWQAIQEIHRRSSGIPRHIDRLCELSLLAATGDHTNRITRDIVCAVADEFALAVA